jgi:hypothetical protein
MFRAPICPSSGVQLVNTSAFRCPYLERIFPSNPTHPVSTRYTKQPLHTHTHNQRSTSACRHITENSLLAKPPHCNSPHHNTRVHYFAYPFQVWPHKSGRYSLIVLLMMGILVSETCWGNKKFILCQHLVGSLPSLLPSIFETLWPTNTGCAV